jgi:hypothetical protein
MWDLKGFLTLRVNNTEMEGLPDGQPFYERPNCGRYGWRRFVDDDKRTDKKQAKSLPYRQADCRQGDGYGKGYRAYDEIKANGKRHCRFPSRKEGLICSAVTEKPF